MTKLSIVTPMWSDIMKPLIDQILALPSGEDITVYQNTPGGSVFQGWAFAGALKIHDGEITIVAMGDCSSMGFYNLLYADKVEALDVTKFTIHRAVLWGSETEDEKLRIDSINTDLRAAMESKIDEAKFTKITKGKTFDDIFDPEARLEVTLTAKQMKQIGVVSKIIPLNDKTIKAFNETAVAFSNMFEKDPTPPNPTPPNPTPPNPEANNDNLNNNKKSIEMTITEIKEKHPEAYKAIIALGVKSEKDRVGAFMAFNKIDPEAVKKAIDEGDEMSETFRSEMQVKAMSPEYLEKIKKEAAPPANPKAEAPKTDAEKTAEEKEVEALSKEVMDDLNIPTKTKED